MTNIYVGNLPFKVTEEELSEAFSEYGKVSKVDIIKDRDSGQPRGFAFVSMVSSEDAAAAMKGLNGTDFAGRRLTVNEARPREPRGGGGNGGGGGRRSRDDRDRW